MGYQSNEYDWCVKKRKFNDKQCTTLWYIENIKMLYVDSNIVNGVLADIDAEYGKIAKMIFTWGNTHK